MPKVFRAAIAVSAALIACCAQASLKEARESIVGTVEHVAIARLRTGPFAIPDELGKGDLVLIATVGAHFGDILVMGPVPGNAKEYAGVLDDWQHTNLHSDNTVLWSQENDYACARLVISNAKFGSRSGSLTLPLGELVASLKARYKLYPVLRVVRGAHLEPAPILADITKGFNTYDLAQVQATYSATVTRHLTSAQVFVTYLFFGLVDIVVLLGFAAAIVVGKSSRIPVERRRKLYSKLAIWPVFGAIGVHAPLAFVYMQSPAIRAVADLWFGTFRVSVMALPMFLALPLVFLCIPAMGAVERRLFGPAKPGDPTPILAAKPPSISDAELAFRKTKVKISLGLAAVGLAIAMYSIFWSPPSLRHVQPLLNLAGMMIMLFSSQLVGLVLRNGSREFESPVEDPKLTAVAEDLARGMDVKLGRVVVDRRPLSRNTLNARITLNGQISVSQRAVESLDAPELRFLLAHEIGHRKAGHLRQYVLVAMLPAFLLVELPVFSMIIGLAGVTRPPWWTPFTFGGAMLGFAWLFIAAKAIRRKQEFEADCLAVEETRDPDAAVSVLKKIVASSGMPHLHEIDDLSTHPAVSKRIAAIQALGRKHGFKSSSAGDGQPSPSGMPA